MKRRVPAQRVAEFKSLAAATRDAGVVLAVRDEVVAGQDRRGVKSAGGELANLHFFILGDEACDKVPQTMAAFNIEPKDKP